MGGACLSLGTLCNRNPKRVHIEVWTILELSRMMLLAGFSVCREMLWKDEAFIRICESSQKARSGKWPSAIQLQGVALEWDEGIPTHLPYP